MPPEILSVKPRQDGPDVPPPPPKPIRNKRFKLPLAIGGLLLLCGFGAVFAMALNEQKQGSTKPPVTTADNTKLAQVPTPSTAPTQLTVTQLSAQNSELINLLAKALQVSNNLAVQGNVTVGGSLTAGSLAGSGSGVTNVNAALLGGQPSSYYAGLAGNATHALSQLQASVALLAAPNTFLATNTFSSNLIVQGNLTASSLKLTTALPVSSGGTGLLNVPAASVLYGQGTATLGVATPASSGLCLLSGTTDVTWGPCISGTSDVTSLNGLTGALMVADSTAAGGLITINSAKANGTTLGIATFNATNFTDNGSGVINTVQDLAPASAPTFAQLLLTSSSAGALKVEQTGVHNNVLVVDTANGSVGINQAPNINNALTVTGTAGFTGTVQAPNFTLTDGDNVNGFLKNYSIGTGGVSAHDVVVLANDAGVSKVIDTATARDPRVMGVALSAGAASAIVSIAVGGNASVTADTGVVAIGDQLVTSATAGQVTVDNTATTGVLGYATSAKAAGSSGLVGVYVRPTGGTTNPNIPGNLTVQGTITANTITPTAALTLGATGQQFTLQGTSASTITGTGGGFTTTVGFSGIPAASQTYNFDRTTAAGTYTICTTANNCSSGATGIGGTGTAGKLAKFTGAGTIGDSSISDTGSSVTIMPATDSATAFQIQNAASGTSFLTADSINQIIATKDLNIGSPTKIGANRFADGFESGNFSLWTGTTNQSGTSTITVGTAQVRNGKYAAQLNLTGSGHARMNANFASINAPNARSYVYVTSQGATNLNLMGIANSTGSSPFELYRDQATGKLSFFNPITSSSTVGSTVLTTGTWHQIELDLNISGGTVSAYLDGTQVINLSTQNLGAANMVFIQIGDPTDGDTGVFSVDDVAVDSVRPGDSAGVNVQDGLHVSGTASFNGNTLFQDVNNIQNALVLQNVAGAQVLDVDTFNNNIKLNGGNASYLGSNQGTAWSTTTSLPSTRHGGGVLYANGYVFFLGGDGTNVWSAKQNSDGTLSSWTPLNNLPVGPTEAYYGTSNGYIYVVGGSNAGYLNTTYYAKIKQDGTIGSWITSPQTLPIAEQPFNAGAIANGYIYILGGYNGSAQSAVYYAKLHSDGSIGAWQTNSNSLTAPMYNGSAVVANGFIFLMGGSGNSNHVQKAQINSDGTLGAFSSIAESNMLQYNASWVADGNIYTLNGWDGTVCETNTTLNSVSNTGALGNSSTAGALLSAGDCFTQAAVGNGYVYLIGGNGPTGAADISTSYYTSLPRVQIGGSLDLVALNGNTMANQGSGSAGSLAGSLTAGAGNFLSTLQVQGAATFNQSLAVNGTLNVGSDATFANTSNSVGAFQVQNASGTTLLGVDTATTLNLLPETASNFENGTTWTAKGTGATVTQDNTQSYLGSYSTKIVTTATANAGAQYSYNLAANTSYTFTFYARASAQGSTYNLGHQDQSGTDVDCSTGAFIPASGWAKLSCSFTTGATVSSPNIYLKDTGTGHTFWIDAVQLLQTSNTTAGPVNIGGQVQINGIINSPLSVQNTANSNTELAVYNTNGSILFDVDSNNSRIGIGTANGGNDLSFSAGNKTIGLNASSAGAGGSLTISAGNGATGNTGGNLVLKAGANGTGNGAPGSVIVQANGGDSTTAFQIQNATGTSTVLNVDTSNLRVDVGTAGTATGQLYVSGSVPSSKLGSITEGGIGGGVYVQGRYAYTTDAINKVLHIVDVSNPASPADIGSLVLSGAPQKVFVQGRYAYVTTQSIDAVDIIDVSNPAAPVQVGSTSTGINTPFGVYAQGRYLYVTNIPATTNSISVYDVSNPAQPTQVGTVNTDGGIANAQSGNLFVSGRYLYLVNNNDAAGKGLEVFDISNPASPTSVGSHSTGSTPRGVYVQGRYAYIANFGTPSLTIYDISNPASIPATVGTVSTHTGTQDVYVQGRYAYIVNQGDSTHGLEVIDVSNPASPTSLGSVTTDGGAFGLFISGRYGYVMARGGSAILDTYDLGGTYTQQLQAGGIEAGTLQVRANTEIGGGASLQGGLTVGQTAQVSGDLGVNGSAVFAAATNSATAFQVQNAAGTTQFAVDTSSSVVRSLDTFKVGNSTNTTTPTFEYLSDISTNAGGNALLTGNWFSANNWGIGPNSNASDRTLRVGVTSGNFVNTWDNANNLNLLVTGTETVRPTTGNDSTSAFSVQNASSAPILTVDTVGSGVGINQAPVAGVSLIVSGTAQADNLVVSDGATSGALIKNYSAGTGGVSPNDVVVLANDGGNSRIVDTTAAHDTRVMGVATAVAASGATEPVVIGGNTQVTADTGAVAIGDTLVTSATSGQVTVDNNATTGILGYATTTKAAGSSGLVGVYVHPYNGVASPTINGNLTILNSSKIYLNTSTDGAWTIGREASPSGANLVTTAATVFTVQNTSTEGVMIRNAAGQSVFEVNGLGQTVIKTPTNSAAFQVQNNLGAAVLTADTSSMTVTVQKLTVTADLTVNGHIISGGSTPGIAAGTAACTSPTVSVAGDDTAGTITVTTGTGCAAAGKLATVTFATAFANAPRVTLTPAGLTAAQASGYIDNSTVSTTAFDLDSANPPANTTTYAWNYLIVQ